MATLDPHHCRQPYLTHHRRGTLTPRQEDLIRIMAQDKCLKEAAVVMGISCKTAEYHFARVADFFGTTNKFMVALHARDMGII